MRRPLGNTAADAAAAAATEIAYKKARGEFLTSVQHHDVGNKNLDFHHRYHRGRNRLTQRYGSAGRLVPLLFFFYFVICL